MYMTLFNNTSYGIPSNEEVKSIRQRNMVKAENTLCITVQDNLLLAEKQILYGRSILINEWFKKVVLQSQNQIKIFEVSYESNKWNVKLTQIEARIIDNLIQIKNEKLLRKQIQKIIFQKCGSRRFNGNFLSGGGNLSCCVDRMNDDPYSRDIRVDNEPVDSNLRESFIQLYAENVQKRDHILSILQKEDYLNEMIKLFEESLNKTKLYTKTKDISRVVVIETLDLVLLYLFCSFGLPSTEENEKKHKTLSNLMESTIQGLEQERSHQRDYICFIKFFQYLFDKPFERKESNIENLTKLAKGMLTNLVVLPLQNEGDNSLQKLYKAQSQIIDIFLKSKLNSFHKFENIWEVADKESKFSKDIMTFQLAELWAQNAQKFGQQENQPFSIEWSIIFFMEMFVSSISKSSNSMLIIYILARINYLFEKGGLVDIENEQNAQFIQKISSIFHQNSKIVSTFIAIMQQSFRLTDTNERYMKFIRFTIVDKDFRFLSTQILLKYYFIQNSQNKDSEETKRLYDHLFYTLLTAEFPIQALFPSSLVRLYMNKFEKDADNEHEDIIQEITYHREMRRKYFEDHYVYYDFDFNCDEEKKTESPYQLKCVLMQVSKIC